MMWLYLSLWASGISHFSFGVLNLFSQNLASGITALDIHQSKQMSRRLRKAQILRK